MNIEFEACLPCCPSALSQLKNDFLAGIIRLKSLLYPTNTDIKKPLTAAEGLKGV